MVYTLHPLLKLNEGEVEEGLGKSERWKNWIHIFRYLVSYRTAKVLKEVALYENGSLIFAY